MVADLATTQPAAASELTPVLPDLLDDPWSRVAAARALWRLGTPPAELVAPLIAAITAAYGGRGALPLLAGMQAVEAIADLQQLAERDGRIVTSTNDDDLVWQDEKLQDQLRAASPHSARRDSGNARARHPRTGYRPVSPAAARRESASGARQVSSSDRSERGHGTGGGTKRFAEE